MHERDAAKFTVWLPVEQKTLTETVSALQGAGAKPKRKPQPATKQTIRDIEPSFRPKEGHHLQEAVPHFGHREQSHVQSIVQRNPGVNARTSSYATNHTFFRAAVTYW